MRIKGLAVAAMVVFLALGSASAQTAADGPWKGSVGFSFLSTSGNSDAQSLGLDFALKRDPTPWGVEVTAKALRAEDHGQLTVERYLAGVRGSRALDVRWSVFAGASGLKDTFAGVDFRGMVEAGVSMKALEGPEHVLVVDAGLTWTSEDPTVGDRFDYLGGIAGAAYIWNVSTTSSLSEAVRFYPNFDTSSDWRATSEAALKTNLTEILALKLGYEVRYDNRPIAGFKKTDTATTASVVVSF